LRLVTFLPATGAARVGELRPDHTVVELHAPTMIDWLAGEGRSPAGPTYALADVRLLAPIPEPPSVRDFYTYEAHVAAGFRSRGASQIPPAWYEHPVFYFSNPASIHGPGEPVKRPPNCERLDFELEIAKGKDFATSLGPWLVTPDELPYDGEWLDLPATVTVNDRPVARCESQPMHFSWPEVAAYAAANTRLRPGDVLGSGTLAGGCLLELGPIDGRWLEPGDTVSLWAQGLGELRAEIV